MLHEYSFISDACLVAAFDAASSTWAITHGHEAIDDHELHDVLQSLHCVIRKAIRRHILPPTGIGSLHQNVSHKFHAFLHGLRLECGSWAETQHLISKYFAICTDMGVESKLTMAEAVAGELFSYWCDFNMDDDEGGPNEREIVLSLRSALHIPGVFHTVENLQLRLLRYLPSWTDRVKPQVDSACIVFHYRFTRARFSETCLTGEDAVWEAWFTTGPPLLDGGRVWGTTVEITTWFLAREAPLRTLWDEAKVSFREQAGDAPEGAPLLPRENWTEDTSKHIRICNDAITSAFFWAYLKLLAALSAIISHVEAWSQACFCHEKEFCEHHGVDTMKNTCWMRGRRVPELCCSELQRFVQEVADKGHAQLLHSIMDLIDADKVIILSEFSFGKNMVSMELQVRLDCAAQLPLKLMCVGHYDMREVKNNLAICLILFEDVRNNGRELHPLLVIMLSFEGDIREMIFLVLEGRDIQELPEGIVFGELRDSCLSWKDRSKASTRILVITSASRLTIQRPTRASASGATRSCRPSTADVKGPLYRKWQCCSNEFAQSWIPWST